MNYCPNCGEKVSEGADVCLKCGKMLKNNKSINLSTDIPDGRRSKIIAALLAFFLGSLGIHNFYLGYNTKGTWQLILTLVGWIIIVGPIISGIWALVEFVQILTGSINDANGNKLL